MQHSNAHAFYDSTEEPQVGGGRGPGINLVLLLIAALGAGAVFFTVNSRAQSARLVWVVNGTQKPYDIEIDGQIFTVPFGDPLELELSEGTHSVKIVPPVWGEDVSAEAAAARAEFMDRWVPAAQTQAFTLKSRLGLAALDSTTYVLNPDGAALLVVSDVVYGDKTPALKRAEPLALFHTFDEVDDVFAESPKSVEASGGVIRQRLDSLTYEDRSGARGLAGVPLAEAELKKQAAARLAMDFDGFYWRQEARKWLDEAESAQLILTRATSSPKDSIVPPMPRIKIPPPPVSVFGTARTDPPE